jgi:transcription initiation factor TFIID subunit 10
VRVKRIIGLAAQKFISDLASDAIAHSKTRMNKKGKGGKLTLQMDDLQSALASKGVSVNKPDYYT